MGTINGAEKFPKCHLVEEFYMEAIITNPRKVGFFGYRYSLQCVGLRV